MTDRVYPSSKPGPGSGPAPPPASAAAAKPPNLYNPARVPYRQPHHRSYRRRRNYCCCFCFWAILLLLLLALLAAIAGSALYVLYRPHRPSFDVTSLRVARLNLTTTADAASSHLSALLNLTVSAHNPNRHINFFYEPFTVYAVTASGDGVALGNGTLPAFASFNQNTTALRPIVAGSVDLDPDSARSLRSDLKKRGGAPIKIRMDTNVRVKVGGFKSRKVGIKVTCAGIRAAQPKGRVAAVASVKNSDCSVDLRIKIWRWTY